MRLLERDCKGRQPGISGHNLSPFVAHSSKHALLHQNRDGCLRAGRVLPVPLLPKSERVQRRCVCSRRSSNSRAATKKEAVRPSRCVFCAAATRSDRPRREPVGVRDVVSCGLHEARLGGSSVSESINKRRFMALKKSSPLAGLQQCPSCGRSGSSYARQPRLLHAMFSRYPFYHQATIFCLAGFGFLPKRGARFARYPSDNVVFQHLQERINRGVCRFGW